MAWLLRNCFPSSLPQAACLAFGITFLLGVLASGGSAVPCTKRKKEAYRGVFLLRQVVPILFIGTVSVIGPHLGTKTCGLLTSFPLMSWLTFTLVVLESGPRAVSQIAAAYPFGNMAAIAFFAAFALSSQCFALASSVFISIVACTAAAYLGSLCSKWTRLFHERRRLTLSCLLGSNSTCAV